MTIFYTILTRNCPTVSVTDAEADVDSAWEQRKLEARKMLVNRTDSPASSARGVGRSSASTHGRNQITPKSD